jgi:signal transduction histidine kinase
VKDDGRGMGKNISAGGNGLLNMQARAKEIGMQLTITSTINEGTVLLLETTTIN